MTLSDSVVGNIHTVEVKGHSEVVDGAIKSIGDAGWGVVNLGELIWQVAGDAPSSTYYVQSLPNGTSNDNNKTYLCNYVQYSGSLVNMPDKSIRGMGGQSGVYVRDTSYTDATQFKSAMSGVLLYYPLADTTGATPTFGITSKDGVGQGTAATITTGLPLRSVSDSITDELTNTKVIKKYAEVDLGDLTWNYKTDGSVYAPFFYATLEGIKSHGNPQYFAALILCAPYVTVRRQPAEFIDGTICGDGSVTEINQLQIKDSRYTDAETFKAAMSGVKLVYELATPTETPLTSAEVAALAALETYDPTTVISATDNPSITVKYIGKKTATRTAPKKRTSRKKKS